MPNRECNVTKRVRTRIGWPLKDGYPHEMRAANYDDLL
jgi:asparagine synthetase A